MKTMKHLTMTALCLALCLFMSNDATAQLKVASDGNVGVGVTNPVAKLQVNGNTRVDGPLLFVGRNVGSGTSLVEVGAGRSANGNAGIRFFTNVGQPSGFNFVRQSSGVSRLRHFGAQDFEITAVNAAQTVFRTSDVPRMIIRSGGQVDILGTATVNGGVMVTSDRRLKSNVKKLRRGLDELMQLTPVTYKYTGKANTSTDREFVGLIAQELHKVAPEFVSKQLFEEKDTEGRVINSETYLRIHDSELKYLMINSIQEQQLIIREQEDRILKLEQDISELKEMINILRPESHPGSKKSAVLENPAESLFQNRPNPTNNSTIIEYNIQNELKNASLEFTDMNGRLLKVVELTAPSGEVEIKTHELASGNYIYSLRNDGKIINRRTMSVIK